MILEFIVNVPFAEQQHLKQSKDQWFKFFCQTKKSVGFMFRFNKKSILFEKDNLEKGLFVWHIKVDQRNEKYLGRFVRNIVTNNAVASETFNNAISYKKIKRKTGATNEQMVIAKYLLGGYINNYCSDDEYDYKNNIFPEKKEYKSPIIDNAVYGMELDKAKKLDKVDDLNPETKKSLISELKQRIKRFGKEEIENV